eukprot:c56382_g1_i1 orf=1-198(-)
MCTHSLKVCVAAVHFSHSTSRIDRWDCENLSYLYTLQEEIKSCFHSKALAFLFCHLCCEALQKSHP